MVIKFKVGDYFLKEETIGRNTPSPYKKLTIGILTSELKDNPKEFSFYDLFKGKQRKHESIIPEWEVDDINGIFKKSAKNKIVELLTKKIDQHNTHIKLGDFQGALAAREACDLEQVLNRLKTRSPLKALERKIERPYTGIHVVKARKVEEYESIQMPVNYSESNVETFLDLFYKDGFGKISPESEPHSYEVTEIPKKAIKLVDPSLIVDVTEAD